MISDDSSYRNNIRVSGRQYPDALGAVDRIHDLSVPHIDPHMSAVENQIARNCLIIADRGSYTHQVSRGAWKADAKMCKH